MKTPALAPWEIVWRHQAEAVAAERDELPLPYHYDVQPFATIKLQSLRAPIERVGILIYPQPAVKTAGSPFN